MPVHQRIRPFNTKDTYPEQNLSNDLSQGVVARGTMVFLRGQVAQDLDSRESLHAGDAGQADGKGHGRTSRCCWKRPVPSSLISAGLSFM